MARSTFNQIFGFNTHKIKESKLSCSLNMVGFEFNELDISRLNYEVKMRQIRVKWRVSDVLKTSFFYENTQSLIECNPMKYEIFIKTENNLSNNFFKSSFFTSSLLKTLEESFTHKLEYYSSFESKKYDKILKIGNYIPLFYFKNKSLVENESIEKLYQNYDSLKQKLTSYGMEISRITFHNIFEKSFTSEESKLLVELISLKTRTEELFNSIQSNIEYSIILMKIMRETNENALNLVYKNNLILGTLLSSNCGFIYIKEEDISKNINTLVNNEYEIIY